MATLSSGETKSSSSGSKSNDMLICPVLEDPSSLSPEEVLSFLTREIIINIFEKKCLKKEATVSNEWRERLFVFIFNTPNPYPENPIWVYYYTEVGHIKKAMRSREAIPEQHIRKEYLEQRAGMGHNYDFDYIVILDDGRELKFKYEYKHHRPQCLPQLLSLFDTSNIPDGGAPIENGKYAGRFNPLYNCSQATPIEDKFQFWRDHPFWRWHFNDQTNGIPAIRRELATQGIELPEITEEDYFCHVKQLLIPGRSSSIRADSLEELEESFDANTKKKKLKKEKHLNKMKSWLRYGEIRYPEDPSKILRFFRILHDNNNNKNIKNIRNKKSIKNYLNAFRDGEIASSERIFHEIRQREEGKRFIFYYPGAGQWRIGEYPEHFNMKVSDNAVTTKGTKIYLNTDDGNRLEFNIRWANVLGLQNTAWQMNILQGTKGKKRLMPNMFTKFRPEPAMNATCSFLYSDIEHEGGNKYKKTRKKNKFKRNRKSKKKKSRKYISKKQKKTRNTRKTR